MEKGTVSRRSFLFVKINFCKYRKMFLTFILSESEESYSEPFRYDEALAGLSYVSVSCA